MNESNQILNKIGRHDGMTVPEGYFADFVKQMESSLPHREIAEKPKPTLWFRIRPYVYMAAMFAGIYCMMEMFSMFKSNSGDLNMDNYPTLRATLESNAPDAEMLYEFNDYDILEDMITEGFSAEDLVMTDDSLDATVIPASYNQ